MGRRLHRLVPFLLAFLLGGCGGDAVPDVAPDERAPAEPGPPVQRSPGTERMVERLALLADHLPVMDDPFRNRERVAELRALEPPTDPAERRRAELRLAVELLRAGESEAAAERFETVLAAMVEEPSRHPPGLARRVRSLLAVAYLRLGEQENCLMHHSADACLLPIRGSGVHRLERGSRSALAELATLLREDPDDLLSRWLYNLAAMTLGEHPQGVPAEWRISPDLFASDHDPGRFFDRAPELGLATVSLAGGAVVEDLDGDGLLDVMVSSWGLRDPLRFFRQRRDGGRIRFEERSREAGLDGLTGGLNLVHADYDNDGDADVLVLRGAWMERQGRQPNSLLRNDGRGFFEDVTEEVGLLSFHPTQTAAWGDVDNDGWLDLYVGNESTPGDPHPCELYRNNGGEGGKVTFTEIAGPAGVAAGGYVKGVAWGDVDNDGWLDLYLSRMGAPNLLFHNQGPGAGGAVTFVEIGREAGVTEPIDSFPVWFFDVDNDGWLDLFAADYATSFLEARATGTVASYLGLPFEGSTTRLYSNLGAGPGGRPRFADVTAAAGLDHQLLAMGANFGDLDNDGWLDLYVGTGAPDLSALVPNRMFRNDGGRSFQDVTTAGGFGHLQKGHAIAFADFDDDGDQDVFEVLGGAFAGDLYPNALFVNPGHGHRWITLRLEGTTANRAAVGARLRLELETPVGPRQIHVTVGTGGSFGSSSLQQEIGLGDATALPTVEVTWPGGERQLFHHLPLDRIVRLREGDPEPVVVERDDRSGRSVD
jgi:hypothetical protein